MEKLRFSGGDTLQPSEGGKRGLYTSAGGDSVTVTIQGIDEYGGATFTNPNGVQFYQSGSRAVQVNPLTAPTISPMNLPARPSAPGNPPAAQPGVGFRNGNMNRGQRPPTASEYRLGPGAGWVRKTGSTPVPPQNNVVQWMARGSDIMPLNPSFAANGARNLIDLVVPQGYRLRLSSYSLDLGPSVFWEDNLIWRLKVGETDLFNPFGKRMGATRNIYQALGLVGSNLWTGRPVRSNAVVPFTQIQDDLLTVEAGTRIQLSVQSVESWPSGTPPTDILAGTIWGSLWGVK